MRASVEVSVAQVRQTDLVTRDLPQHDTCTKYGSPLATPASPLP